MSIAQFAIAERAIADAGPFDLPASAPTLSELLESGDYVIAAEQHFVTIGTALEHVLIIGSAGFTTRASDDPPTYEVAPLLTGEVKVDREISITETSNLTGEQSGGIRMIVPNVGVYLHTVGVGSTLEPLTILQVQRQCSGQLFRLKVGRPSFGYASFITVFETRAEALEQDGIGAMRLRLRDSGFNLASGLLDTWAGTGNEDGTADLAGEVRGRHYGASRNVTARLALPATLTHHVSDRVPTVPLPFVRDGGVALVEDTTGYPFADWADFQAHSLAGATNTWVQFEGWFRTKAKPLGVVTVDFGDVMTLPEIIRAMLEEGGVPSAQISIVTEDFAFGADNSRSVEWQAVAEMLSVAPAQQYISEQENLIDAVDRLAKRHGLSRYQDRDGRICFDIMDYRLHPDAVSGVDYTVISVADAISLTPQVLPSTIWPPRFREYLLYDQNHTVMTQDQVFDLADDAFRQGAVAAGRTLYVPDVTPANSPIKLGLSSAIDPARNDTALVAQADAQALGEWLQTRSALTRTSGAAFLSQRRAFRCRAPIAGYYDLPFFRVIKIRVPNYWPDGDLNLICQMLPPSEDWRTGMLEFDCLAYGFTHCQVYVASAPFTSGANYMITSGDRAFTTESGRVNTIDISNKNTPVKVAEFEDSRLLGAKGIFEFGDFLFVACYNNDSLTILDKSDPDALVFVSEFKGPVPGTTLNGAFRVVVDAAGEYAYVLCTDDNYLEVVAVNVADLYSPIYIQSSRIFSSGYSNVDSYEISISEDGNYIFVAIPIGIISFNVTNPFLANQYVDSLYFGDVGVSNFGEMVVRQSVMFVSVNDVSTNNRRGGLMIIDISPTGQLDVRSSILGPEQRTIINARSVAVAGGYAYVGYDSLPGQVEVYDVTDLDNPALIGPVRGLALFDSSLIKSVRSTVDGYLCLLVPGGLIVVG